MIALYDTHEEAENAIVKLEQNGFDIKKLSLVDKDYYTTENVIGYSEKDDRTDDKAVQYDSQLKAGKIMLVANDSDFNIESARAVLGLTIPKENLNLQPDAIVLSGGERSPLQ